MTNARSELTVRLAALAASLSVPVSYENVAFTKPLNNGPFLEMFIVPAYTKDVTVDGTRQRLTGFMQCNVWCPQGKGTKQGEDIANAIVSAFPVVPKTGAVSVEATPTIKQAVLDTSGYRIIPVCVEFRMEVFSA